MLARMWTDWKLATMHDMRVRAVTLPTHCMSLSPPLPRGFSSISFGGCRREDLVVVDTRGVTVLFHAADWAFGNALTVLQDSGSYLFLATHSHFRLDLMDVDNDGTVSTLSPACSDAHGPMCCHMFVYPRPRACTSVCALCARM